LFNIIVNVKKVFAYDEFLGNVTRPELFEITDFKVPTITIHLNDYDYSYLFNAIQCEKDTSSNFMKRNMDCYTTPWVDLNYALNRTISKKYIDKSKITEKADIELIVSVLNTKTHNITISEFENLIVTYSKFTLKEIFTYPYGLASVPSTTNFKTEDATMTFDLEGEKETFNKIKFSIGGRSTRYYSKLGFNINIKGKVLLHDSKQLRLRAEAVDSTFIRDKLAYDLYHLIDLPTLSANYARLYINDTFMGFYLLRDAMKSHWVEQNFGEKGTKHLYSCDHSYGDNLFFNCVNDDTEVQDDDWKGFLSQLENAKDRKDLEKFFDVEIYVRWQVSRYLFGSWDHNTHSHNNVVYMLHNEEKHSDLWIPLLYDFDMNFGHRRVANTTKTFEEEVVDPINPLYELIGLNDESEELRVVMEDIIRKAFNPMLLLPCIDQLKHFIGDYILEDRTPDENGHKPGRFDRTTRFAEETFDYEAFNKNSEFTTLKVKQIYEDRGASSYNILGIKTWVIERFQFACKTYHLDCSFAEDFLRSPYAVDHTIDTMTYEDREYGCNGTSYSCCVLTTTVVTTDGTGKWGIEGNQWCLMKEDKTSSGNCYRCCSNPKTTVYSVDKKGQEWGIEDNQWCGINAVQKCPKGGEYPCCKSCTVVFTDSTKWGVEDGKWCSIPSTC
ncbi:coth protein-domain-containing protein, partial [Neocallimastix sp. 'constans']